MSRNLQTSGRSELVTLIDEAVHTTKVLLESGAYRIESTHAYYNDLSFGC
jgi:hypothetical protein